MAFDELRHDFVIDGGAASDATPHAWFGLESSANVSVAPEEMSDAGSQGHT